MINDKETPENEEGKNDNIDKSTNRHDVDSAEFQSYDLLPDTLKSICDCFDPRDKQMMLLSSIAVMSSIMPNVFGIYNQHRMYTNLFLYVIGKAGSGKGNMIWAKRLISKIQRLNTSSEEENSLLQRLNSNGYTNPQLPANKRIIIPANNSSAGFVQLFEQNGGEGMIFETEGDTLANAFKSDYGNYSDILRNGFQHEAISQYRKTDGVHVNIQNPKLSVLISSTPNQLKRIISDAENGLFSRFMFCFTTPIDEFLDVFKGRGNNRKQTFDTIADEMVILYDKLLKCEGVEIRLSEEQEREFVEFFNKSKSILTNMFHADLDASVNRVGVMMFRIIMILTVLRNKDNSLEGELYCTSEDFQVALELAELLLLGANRAIQLLPQQEEDQMSGDKQKMFQLLPNEFSTKEAKEIGTRCGLAERTVDRFLKSACFEKVKHGTWKKAS